MDNKRGLSLSITAIVVFILALIVFIAALFIFTGIGGEFYDFVKDKLGIGQSLVNGTNIGNLK